MDVVLFEDVGNFASIAREFVARDPYTASVLGSMVEGLESGDRTLAPGSLFIAVFGGASTTLGAAMHTPPFNLFLPRLEEAITAAIAEELARVKRYLRGVTGESGTARCFVAEWESRTGVTSRLEVSERMYRLGALHAPEDVAGVARIATSDDVELAAAWADAFQAEAHPTGAGASEDRTLWARQRIGARLLWLWEDGGAPVSLAGRGPIAGGVARVGPVYTPPSERQHGYGSAVTARASRACLDDGAGEVVLYTDLANPTSNAIYQAIGYEPDHDAEEWVFLARS